MKTSTIIIFAVISVIIFIIIFIVIWFFFLKKKEPKVNCHQQSDWVWSENCLYFDERFLDSSIKSPSNLRPVLTNFTYARGGGESIFLPCWYRFRYVNVKTGGYSDFSDWTQSPVISGSCCLPCPGGIGKCPSTIKTGYEGCALNQPTIGVSIKDSQYSPTHQLSDGSFIFINLHRYVSDDVSDLSPPPKNVDDEIIGFLSPGGYVNGEQYYVWTDVLSNPCKNGCEPPKWCLGSNTGCDKIVCS